MRSMTVAELLVDLVIPRSHSRPHVGDDNPYSEAQFKTPKDRRASAASRMPGPAVVHLRLVQREHCRCGVGFMTPHILHFVPRTVNDSFRAGS
jgi:hypothetical protein